MPSPKLYMLMLGCRPPGRHTEQHDVFFTIAESMSDWVQAIKQFWPEVKGNIHIDAWREVTHVDGYRINVIARDGYNNGTGGQSNSLFFINLGGYRQSEFEEYHYKLLTVANNLDVAKANARKTAFYKHVGFTDAPSHIDDKYGVDADDVHAVNDILPPGLKSRFRIEIIPASIEFPDEIHVGYLPLHKIAK